MGAALAILLQFAPAIIQGVEKLLKKPTAPGAPPVPAGPEKQDAVLVALRALFDRFVIAGIIPAGTQITDDALRGGIEAIFQQLKNSGQLTASASDGALYVLQGTVTPLKLGTAL